MRIVVTGATSGIGRALVERFIKEGHQVLGIGRNFEKYPLKAPNYETYVCDFRKLSELEALLRYLSKQKCDLLILAAGLGYFGPHEEIHFSKIQEMVQVNLSSAMMISQACLRSLKKQKGSLFFISSITATKASPIGAAYSASKAGLSHFANSLWEEVRKYGVRVCLLEPDMTKTDFYERASFSVGSDEDSYLFVDEIVESISFILSQRKGANIRRLEIQPQKHAILRKG